MITKVKLNLKLRRICYLVLSTFNLETIREEIFSITDNQVIIGWELYNLMVSVCQPVNLSVKTEMTTLVPQFFLPAEIPSLRGR